MEKVSPAKDAAEVKQRHAANREAWNEAAVKYTEELEQSIEFIKSGKSSLHSIEKANLGELAEWCRTAIHLQCASGEDTLSLLNEGVERVVGVDISDVHIENARLLTAETGSNASWYRCDILDAPEELNNSADLVYTGRGALCWIHDLDRWAEVISRLLKPGGVMHLFDDHPLIWLLDETVHELKFSNIDYFKGSITCKGWSDEYIGDLGKPVAEMAVKHERLWSISSVVQALINAGLSIEFLGEHAEGYWNVFPMLNEAQKGMIPLTFSVKARKSQQTC